MLDGQPDPAGTDFARHRVALRVYQSDSLPLNPSP